MQYYMPAFTHPSQPPLDWQHESMPISPVVETALPVYHPPSYIHHSEMAADNVNYEYLRQQQDAVPMQPLKSSPPPPKMVGQQ